MLKDFETEEMRNIFSNILQRFEQSESEDSVETFNPPTPPPSSKTPQKSQTKAENPQKSKTKIKAKDFKKTTLARMQAMENKKQDKLKKKTQQLKEKELSTLKSTPDINKNSNFFKSDLNIAERSQKQLKNFKSKIEEQKKKQDLEKEAKITSELTFKPAINEKSSRKRSVEEFFEYNVKWSKRLTEKAEAKKIELEEKEVAEVKSVPNINKTSVYLFEQMGLKKSVEERLLEKGQRVKKKKEDRIKQKDYSYSPIISKRSEKIARKKSSENVFKRLFSSSFLRSESEGRKGESFSAIREKTLDITFSNN